MPIKLVHTGAPELRQRLTEFEEQYQLASSEFVRAFRNGELHETPEFHEWARLFGAWKIATRSTA